MSTALESIKQSEAAKLLGIAPADIREFREKNLTADEWWKEGVPVYWSKAAFDRVKAGRVDVPEEAPADHAPEIVPPPSSEDKPETATVRVIKEARNTRFVYANLNGERISVRCHPRNRSRIVGKTITVSIETHDGLTKYTHKP